MIRNWQTNEAALIEIKPQGYNECEVLAARKKIADHFIDYFAYDWDFKVAYGNEILLNVEQQNKYK